MGELNFRRYLFLVAPWVGVAAMTFSYLRTYDVPGLAAFLIGGFVATGVNAGLRAFFYQNAPSS